MATEHYHGYKRDPYSRKVDTNNEGTRLRCAIPREAGEVILTQPDKELLTQESFKTFTNCEVLVMHNLGISDIRRWSILYNEASYTFVY